MICDRAGKDDQDPDRDPCGNGRKLGAQMLSEKRTLIQVPSAMNNTVGIIDSDYFYSDNEGHIFAKLTNDTNENKTVELGKGQAFCRDFC